MNIIKALIFVGLLAGGFIFFQTTQPGDLTAFVASANVEHPIDAETETIEAVAEVAAESEEEFELAPIDQLYLNDLVANGQRDVAFEFAFEMGDELTEADFTAIQGVGANIGEGRRFSRFPRADLNGPGEWATHFPAREGGANSTQCIGCHNAPLANGAGGIALNVVLDPAHTGDPSQYLERNTTPLFALAIPQRLAEEMSLDLYLQREAGRMQACTQGSATTVLITKGVTFGTLEFTRTTEAPCSVAINTAGLSGVDDDLVVKPFGWKGNEATLRSFTRGAAHNEMGLQGVEMVGDADGDFDGVTNELSVGDLTALTIYMAALERPTSLIELADIGQVTLAADDRAAIMTGQEHFVTVGCNSCHTQEMVLNDPTFREPSQTPGFYDVTFPDGSHPADRGLRPDVVMSFDMLSDPPNNQVTLASGEAYHLGAIKSDASGRGVVNWYTDLKRHDMGTDLADPSAPLGIGAEMFMTRSLASVGSTGPWLHDGRATTLNEAILLHGGEGAQSRDAYVALPAENQEELIAFLENLVIHSTEEEH
ncbi:hypothetical protein DS901_14810 [Loktanella sp. D2R18]|uniref:di-heme oxidoredictase family protein n=1 Tax=Rhodobacterales TaxID=204455 RepID=UPI000DEBBB03|nr:MULTISPECIES: di-heme oxidoredictase family protein [Rhodobacterales]MDO6588762.1 di-heme oxidoredictase family protein [Yoonia sp. 1_MG-2023]RBW42008.1 hypothetical protein DS901_14810 [Loktanella sp. D2R18]